MRVNSNRTVKDRVQILMNFHQLVVKHADELADLIVLEHGKVIERGPAKLGSKKLSPTPFPPIPHRTEQKPSRKSQKETKQSNTQSPFLKLFKAKSSKSVAACIVMMSANRWVLWRRSCHSVSLFVLLIDFR